MRGHLASLALALLPACSDSHTTHTPAAACANADLVSLPDCASGADRFSDEACTVLDDAVSRSLVTDAARAPAITAPAQDQAVPGATPFTFTWQAATARRRDRPRREMTWRDELSRWTTLIPEAQAHCAPFSGQAYELQFVIAGRVELRRQQSATSYTPDPPRWSFLRVTAAGRPIELRVLTARFSENRISSGPFIGSQPRRFTIAP